MSDVATRLRAFVLAGSGISAVIGERMHQGHVPQSSDEAYVWYGRANTDSVRTLDGVSGPLSHTFDVEAISLDVDQVQSLAALIRSRLDNYRGAFDDSTVKGIFVEDHNDDYVPHGIMDDRGWHVSSLSVQVFP